jgi:hypothetical protein
MTKTQEVVAMFVLLAPTGKFEVVACPDNYGVLRRPACTCVTA